MATEAARIRTLGFAQVSPSPQSAAHRSGTAVALQAVRKFVSPGRFPAGDARSPDSRLLKKSRGTTLAKRRAHPCPAPE